MNTASILCLSSGVIILTISIVNFFSAQDLNPSFIRAEVLLCMSAVGLMLISTLWTKGDSITLGKSILKGEQGFFLLDDIDSHIRDELAWGSHLFLTATSCATILVYWNNNTLLRRGLITNQYFEPGPICMRAKETGKLVSLVNTKFYPGKKEFDPLNPLLPSILVCPLGKDGWVILGGHTERCFTKSDEIWLDGWSERLKSILISNL